MRMKTMRFYKLSNSSPKLEGDDGRRVSTECAYVPKGGEHSALCDGGPKGPRRGEGVCENAMVSTHSPRFARPSNLEGQFRRLTMAMAALALTLTTSCTKHDELSPAAIELTTPVIQLSSLHSPLSTRTVASTRAAQTLESVANYARINLFLHDSEAREYKYDREGNYEGDFSDGIDWTANPSITVTGGEGHYRAGIVANIELNATDGMPAIGGTIYAYRGSVNVKADGTFTPDGTLKPYSAAVLLKLKDADGNIIDPDKYDTSDGQYAEGAKMNYAMYLIKPVGLARMNVFAAGTDGQHFPNGTAEPVPTAYTHSAYELTSSALGTFTPGTYPATWTDGGALVTTEGTPANAWPLFEVTYCAEGFSGSTSNGTATTWTVSYPATQLKLEPGKLYTFTATLGADAHITLDAGSVSISDWTEGNAINIGR